MLASTPLNSRLAPWLLAAALILTGSLPIGFSAGASAGSQALSQSLFQADLGGMVAELGSPKLAARTAAEQRLAAVLGASAGAGAKRESYEAALDELRRTLSAPDSTGRMLAASRRLSIILGADDRLLGMAIQLATDGRTSVSRVGEEAVLAQLTRWSRSALAEPATAAYDPPRQLAGLPRPLLERSSFPIALDPNGNAPDSQIGSSGASAFDLLDRRGGAPLPIVVDPTFVERMARRPATRLGAARIDGSWAEVLEQLCAIHDGAYQLQGYRFPGEVFPSDLSMGDDLPPARAWIHVVQRGTTQIAPIGRDLRKTGATTIVEWCRSAGREGDFIRQGAAARALAVLGWPAATHWLERRWAWYRDVPALEGLMAAAARGRVAASLQDPRCMQTILNLVERDAQTLERLRVARVKAIAPATLRDTGGRYEAAASALDGRLQRLALGLRQLVPMLALGERLQPLNELLFADFARVSRQGQWLRLAIAEGLGVESASAARSARSILGLAFEFQPGSQSQGSQSLRTQPSGPEAALLRPLRRQALRTLAVVRPLRAAGDGPRVRVAAVGDFFAPGVVEGRRDAAGLGLELGRLEPLEVHFAEGRGFDWSSLDRRPEVLREILIWAALAADGATESEVAPDWVVQGVKAGLREVQASRSPDVRGLRRTAIRLGARELRVLGGTSLPALLRWVKPRLARADFFLFESLLVQAGAFSVGTPTFAGGGDPVRQRVLKRALTALQDSSEDALAVERSWLDLAALGADEEFGARARRELSDSLGRALSQPSRTAATSSTLAFAAESALKALQEARLDAEAQDFLGDLQQAAKAADHPLGQRFRLPDWPPRPASVPRDLERVDPVRPPVFRFR